MYPRSTFPASVSAPVHRAAAIRSSRSAMTLIEIVLAMLILAFAFIPVIGVIGSGSADTDVTKSYVFAQTLVRNILTSCLDSIPFAAIDTNGTTTVSDSDGQTNTDIGLFRVTGSFTNASATNFLRDHFGNTADLNGRGDVTDERGIIYHVNLFAFPITDPDATISTTTEVLFLARNRPEYENQVTNTPARNIWYQTGATGQFVAAGTRTPYEFTTSIQTWDARRMNLPVDPSGQICTMKRLLVRVRWVMPKGVERRLEFYTCKANLF